MVETDNLKSQIKRKALELGFSAVGITNAQPLTKAGELLQQWIDLGKHGTMNWMKSTMFQRMDPASLFSNVQSILLVALNYFREKEEKIFPPESGNISIYARGRDYHKVIKQKLKTLLKWLKEIDPNCQGRIFVDSFPIMEKPLAVRAGLGWIGKNTMLILKGKGSFFFLGGILLSLPLPPDEPFTENFCGECNRCQKACPTGALEFPGLIDARRCISYLTIEHLGPIDKYLHPLIGNHIFGCDICQIVCPWNRFAKNTQESDFFSRFSSLELSLYRLADLNQKEYNKLFDGTPVRRIKYDRFKRNVQIALENLKSKNKKFRKNCSN